MKLNPPSFVSNEKTYELWKTEIKAMEKINPFTSANRFCGLCVMSSEI